MKISINRAHWTRSVLKINQAKRLDDHPISLLALELRSITNSMNFKESIRIAKLLIKL